LIGSCARACVVLAIAFGALWPVAVARSSWSGPLTLSHGPSAEDSRAAVGADGRAVVVWERHYDGSTRSIEAAGSEGSAFGKVIVLSEPFHTDPYVYAESDA
jgi:hypothetical protein